MSFRVASLEWYWTYRARIAVVDSAGRWEAVRVKTTDRPRRSVEVSLHWGDKPVVTPVGTRVYGHLFRRPGAAYDLARAFVEAGDLAAFAALGDELDVGWMQDFFLG